MTSLFRDLRLAWKGIYVANGGYDAARGERAVSDGSADAVAYGRLFIANPDLPKRLSRRGPLNVPDTGSFYGGDERGYIDYPEWARAEADEAADSYECFRLLKRGDV
jgi:N-ethylmaleimide reductase